MTFPDSINGMCLGWKADESDEACSDYKTDLPENCCK